MSRNLAALFAGLARPLPRQVRIPPVPEPLPEWVDPDPEAVPAEGAEGASAAVESAAGRARVLARAARAGHDAATRSALANLLPGLPARERRQIAAPWQPDRDGFLRFGPYRAEQTSATTCGSASLVVLAAAGDPVFAAWLVAGRELGALPAFLGSAAAGLTANDRFAVAQAAMLRATSRQALGPLPWPRALGTPPWTAAREARFPGVRFGQQPVDDGDGPGMTRLLGLIRASLARGVPVPLFTGGDPTFGWTTAVPRHVVLAVPPVARWSAAARAGGPGGAVVDVYEPTTARVHAVAEEEFCGRREPHPAFGNWAHVCWAVVPRAAEPSREG